MTFKVGETVVYPHHGAALIEAIETRTIKGEEKIYLVLKVAQGDLTVRVPADNAEIVGVRDVVGQAGLDKVFEVLRAPAVEEPTIAAYHSLSFSPTGSAPAETSPSTTSPGGGSGGLTAWSNPTARRQTTTRVTARMPGLAIVER